MTRWQSETKIRDRLVSRVEAIGGACELHTCPGTRGDPDTLCSFPWGFHCMVETKWAIDAKPETHQLRRHWFWMSRGMPVLVARCDVEIERVIWVALRAKAVSDHRGELPSGSSPLHVGGGSRLGQDGDGAPRFGIAEDGRVVVLPGPGNRAKARS